MSDNPFGDPNPFAPAGDQGAAQGDNPFSEENPFSDPTEAPSPGDAAPASLDVPPAETASGSGGIGSGGGGFFKPLSPKGARGTKGGAPAGAPSGGSGNSGGSFGPASAGGGNSSNDLQRREQALERREAELKRREEELRRNGGGKVKNWPRCYPLIYHDIEGEIPDEYQKMVKKNFWAWNGLVVCLVWNFIGVTLAWAGGAIPDDAAAAWFLAALYLVCGAPLGFLFWYMRLYEATQKDKALTYASYFLFKFIHVVYCGWAAVGPPLGAYAGSAFVGFMPMVEFAFKHSTWLGVIYVIGSSFWGIECLFSFWNIKLVYFRFRAAGGREKFQEEAQQARNDAARTAAGFS